MSKILTDDQYYTAIANAIRKKNNNSQDTFKPSEMSDAIIQSGITLDSIKDVVLYGLPSSEFSHLDPRTIFESGESIYKEEVTLTYSNNSSRRLMVSGSGSVNDGVWASVVSGTIKSTDNYIVLNCMEAGKRIGTTVPITVLQKPIIGSNWNGDKNKADIVSLTFTPNYTPTTYVSTWDASYNRYGTVTAYETSKNNVIITWDNTLRTKLPCYFDLTSMFEGCSSLTKLDLRSLDTSEVSNMATMFYNCTALTSLNLDGFDTSRVTNMQGMFYKCHYLATLTLGSGFKTDNVTNMYGMFAECASLTALDVTGFNTANVTNMNSLFYYCQSLTSLDLSSFNTAKVSNFSYFLTGCSKLTALTIPKRNGSGISNTTTYIYGRNTSYKFAVNATGRTVTLV